MTTISMKFAAVHSLEWLKNGVSVDAGRNLYYRGGLEFLPGRVSVPLVIHHDMDRQVGTVDLIYAADWTPGPFYFARAQVDNLPAWVRRGTPVSFGRWNAVSFPQGEHERVLSAYVKEISLLPPGVEPGEPLACVLSVDRTAAPASTPARAARAPDPVGEVIYGNGQLVRRYYKTPIVIRDGHDVIVNQPDGSQDIYHGAEGYQEALRNGVIAGR